MTTMTRMAATGPHALRRENLARVLREVHLDGSVQRSELSTRTGLRRSTIGQLVADLAGCGLVVEVQGASDGEPGRPSNLVHARWGGAVAIAVEIGVRSLSAAAIGIGGQVRYPQRTSRDPRNLEVEATLDGIVTAVRGVVGHLGSDERVVGVGISVFGVVDAEQGRVRVAPNLGWRDVDLEARVRERLAMVGDVPILLANDADCGAIAEHRRGAGRGSATMVYLSGEVGIGGGLILADELFRGDGFAGEVGHMVVDPRGEQCRCGRSGCLETEAGMAAVLARAGLSPAGSVEEAARRLTDAVDAGDATTVAAVERAIDRLSIGLGNLANLLSPSCIVLGGWLGALHDRFGQRVAAGFAREALRPMREGVRVVSGEVSEASLVGAGELVLGAVVADPLRACTYV